MKATGANPTPGASRATAREIAHLRRRYEHAQATRDRAIARLDQLAADLLELMPEQDDASLVSAAGVAQIGPA